MDNKIIEQLRGEAKDALIHWAKTDKGFFMMKDALEKNILKPQVPIGLVATARKQFYWADALLPNEL